MFLPGLNEIMTQFGVATRRSFETFSIVTFFSLNKLISNFSWNINEIQVRKDVKSLKQFQLFYCKH